MSGSNLAVLAHDADFLGSQLGPFDELIPIGEGEFGVTWLVRRDGAESILKIMTQPVVRDRFMREPGALERLSSPYVMGFRQSGSIEVEGGRDLWWFEGEYVPGGDVGHHIEQRNWPSTEELISFATGVLNGLVAIHGVRVVHRDLKPRNIALRQGDWAAPVILDLGLARFLDIPSITVYPARVGTVPYMSPEQLRGERARKRSDVFSLGVVCYELLFRGEHPFVERGHSLTLEEALERMEEGPRPMAGGQTRGMDDWVRTLLAYRGYERPSASQALAQLSEV